MAKLITLDRLLSCIIRRNSNKLQRLEDREDALVLLKIKAWKLQKKYEYSEKTYSLFYKSLERTIKKDRQGNNLPLHTAFDIAVELENDIITKVHFEEFLKKLSVEDKVIVSMLAENRSYKEIAEVLKIDHKLVAVKIFRRKKEWETTYHL